MASCAEFGVWDAAFMVGTRVRKQEAVVRAPGAGVVVTAEADGCAVGIVVEEVDPASVVVRRLGTARANVDGRFGGDVAAGDPLKCGAAGKLVKADTSGDLVVGTAEEAITTDGQILVTLTGHYTLIRFEPAE